jgi:phosphate transport system permease protein
MGEKSSFTGRRRSRRTRMSVRFSDVAAQTLITVGGIGTIIAVATVCLFLASVVVPLFLPAKAEVHTRTTTTERQVAPVRLALDEYRTIAYTIYPDSLLNSFRLDTGEHLERRVLFEQRTPTAWSFSFDDDTVIVGFADGTMQAVRIGFETMFINEEDAPEQLFELGVGETDRLEDGIAERTPEDQFRFQRLVVEPKGEPQPITTGSFLHIHHVVSKESLHIVALVREGTVSKLQYLRGEMKEDFLTGERSLVFRKPIELPYMRRGGEDARFIRIAGGADKVYAAWRDGHVVRLRTRPVNEAFVAEEFDVVETPGVELTAFEFLLGQTTIITGNSNGELHGWFPVSVQGAQRIADAPPDGFRMVKAKHLRHAGHGESSITSITSATRSRMIAAGFANGDLQVFFVNSEQQLLHKSVQDGRPVLAATISPKEDALLAVTHQHAYVWDFDPRHPEASARSLFLPVWYEGYGEPQFMWQSSSATDDFEPKFSLVPLIFGTLKATFYSMLFGAPLALLAAIYTSEFLNPRVKAGIKPTIEMMASLPSVVLGFLAALVFAPFIEELIPTALSSFVTVPFVFILGAFIWQLLPRRFTLRFGTHRIWFMMPLLPIGLWLAMLVGPVAEQLLFGGQIKMWLHGLHRQPPVGRAWGGLVLLLLPLGALAVAIFMSLVVNPRMRRFAERFDRNKMALIDLSKFAVGVVVTVALVLGLSWMLGGLGFDLRAPLPYIGSFVDTYDQRNSLVVGFVMGFAIIPIIYTIADDALSTVPEHLRGASLGAGATPWQTAIRIVIPTAMSGLFSAMMIGLGRAVGETMIVLMAAGNTPVMNMNIFEGFRTLSANIAVELPEAPIGGTHYRTLFLAALVLFAMTFVVNTVAEAIRLRFRKRAYQL